MDERRRRALKTLLGVGAISSLVGASILTTNLLTQRHVEVIEQIINKTIANTIKAFLNLTPNSLTCSQKGNSLS